ncbi:hypothetical protein [Methylobacterium gnaphalii]|uniref:Uncharacterized protein n=2 Tax=Methylobacterium gnaphalii TaxID=1010610 RepID=A0A512JRA1_9HYPH|nr:hypothetical protein MGN01_43200 [Methylobacterium gnaphalii]GLS50595.1 hypothetical protein GCM10007885_34480 [Methylobacterium gnaphalii]
MHWQTHHNSIRPHSSLGSQPTAPEIVIWPVEPDGSAPSARAAIVTVMNALETKFEGWEEAAHPATRDTPLWAANSGRISETAIVDVQERGAIVYIVTAFVD